jgi:hypothetical protein
VYELARIVLCWVRVLRIERGMHKQTSMSVKLERTVWISNVDFCDAQIILGTDGPTQAGAIHGYIVEEAICQRSSGSHPSLSHPAVPSKQLLRCIVRTKLGAQQTTKSARPSSHTRPKCKLRAVIGRISMDVQPTTPIGLLPAIRREMHKTLWHFAANRFFDFCMTSMHMHLLSQTFDEAKAEAMDMASF